MIYTVTFNPAIDYVVHLKELKKGGLNRNISEDYQVGGKGINVSCVLKTLGIENTALGFVAGFTGEGLENTLKDMGVNCDFIHLKEGMTRINVKVKAEEETEINGAGPKISDEEISLLYKQLENLENGDTLILSGSIPSSLPGDTYEKIMATLDGKGIFIVVDASKDLLKNVMKYHPFLVKPNREELSEIFGKELDTDDKIISCAKELQEMGGRNILVSMAGDGAILLDEKGEIHRIGCPKGTVINSVGAGDSMVAGFIAGCCESTDFDYALKLGTAAGSATAFSLGLCCKEDVIKLFETL